MLDVSLQKIHKTCNFIIYLPKNLIIQVTLNLNPWGPLVIILSKRRKKKYFPKNVE